MSDPYRAFDGTLWVGTGFPGTVYKSFNQGLSWTWDAVLDDVVNDFCVSSAGTLLAATGMEGKIYRSLDGETWSFSTIIPQAGNVHSILETSQGYLLCGTGDEWGLIYRSIDDGVNWMEMPWPAQGDVKAVRQLAEDDDGDLYALIETNNYLEEIWFSEDAGWTWYCMPNMISNNIHDLMVDSEGNVYAAAGNPGGVYRWVRDTEMWIEVGHLPAEEEVLTVLSMPCVQPTATFTPRPTATATSIPSPTPAFPSMVVYFDNDDAPFSWTCGDERIYCFGTTHDGTDYYRTATVKNEGGGTLNVMMSLSGADNDLFEVEGGMSFPLLPAASKDIRIRFMPQPPPGEKEATLEIKGGDKTERIQLKGGYSF